MKLVTSESVFKGHPDKICDQISDAILDKILEQDKDARVAVETAIKDELIFIFGEVTTSAKVDYSKIAKQVIKEIGYNEDYKVIEKISEQSKDIAIGVDIKEDHEQGAGDQGIMFGYACKETKELMPLAITLANKLSKQMDKTRQAKYQNIFGPDGKCQVTVRYNSPKEATVDTIVFSAQTKPGVNLEQAKQIILDEVISKVIKEDLNNINILINPTGKFEIGGSYADSGLTGRKIIVDTYGGYAKHGGGAFSGKDVSKVDRSAAYYCRFVAKAVVGANLASKCEVSVAYSIGIANPISLSVDTFGTGIISDEELTKLVFKAFNFKPASIKKELELDKIKYQPLATYGHMGREDLQVKWEGVDSKVKELKEEYEKTKSIT